MSISEDELEHILSEVEENAQRAEDRGLEHGTNADIVQAQLALGAKRAIKEIRRKLQWREQAIARLPVRSHRSAG